MGKDTWFSRDGGEDVEQGAGRRARRAGATSEREREGERAGTRARDRGGREGWDDAASSATNGDAKAPGRGRRCASRILNRSS